MMTMKKGEMKSLIKECLHDSDKLSANLNFILEVFNKYRVDYGYPPALEVKVQKSKKWGKQMQFTTEHGTLSYIKAVDHYFGKKETPEQTFKKACRAYLHPYMMDFKRSTLPLNCPYTGIELTVDNSHVDHIGEYEFNDIANKYIATITLNDVKYRNTPDGVEFLNKSDGQDFKRFHDNLAKLELVHSSWNLSRVKSKLI